MPCWVGVNTSYSDCNCPDRVVTVCGELTGVALVLHSTSRSGVGPRTSILGTCTAVEYWRTIEGICIYRICRIRAFGPIKSSLAFILDVN